MPKPTDPPPPRAELGAPQRQRLAQMETELDRTRGDMARQRRELDELRARLEARQAQVEEVLAKVERLPAGGPPEALETRFAALDARREALAEELRGRLTELGAGAGGERLEALDHRLRALEEGTELSRIRMRLERVGHRLDAMDGRLGALEGGQDRLREALARAEKTEARVERLESLFDELVEELREQRDGRDVDELRARLDDFETLVLKAGSDERRLREQLEAQTATIRQLRESMVPPAAAGPGSDDLTRIKGIGPKYARLLQDAGVTTFAQIAAWRDEDVEAIASRIGVKPSRIRRAGWIESAARLAG
jgi:predicted flap endonuclease-1-like 5' DNA nuclease